MQTPSTAPAQPLISRRSVLVACLGVIVSALVIGSGKASQDAAGILFALFWGVFAVSLLVAYAGAVVLALRVRSLLLLLLVFVIPVPPFGPLLCALLTNVVAAPGGRGGRR